MHPSTLRDQLVWVTPTCAVNPANILEVFRAKDGHLEVYLFGRTRQLPEGQLTEAGRALLLPSDETSVASAAHADGYAAESGARSGFDRADLRH